MLKIFDLSLKLNGFPIDKAKKEYEKIIAIPEQEYGKYLAERKSAIVKHHYQNNPFYRKLIGAQLPERWEDLPVLTKRDLQCPLEERLANGYTKKNVFVNKTSGSSGDPFIFAKDKDAHALTWASIIDKFGWYGVDFNSSYQARFYGIPLDFIGNKKERLKDVLSKRYRFSVFDLSDQVLEGVLQHFSQKKFDYINGYTSSIVMFAKFLQSKGIVLKQVCPTLKVCIVTSEMLFEEDKLLLERQFGLPVVNEYGASELDLIAFQNPADSWHVNAETLFVEILDQNNKPVPYGEEGKIVITSLYNKAHPFIRYEIGDIGTLSVKSTLKNPVLEKLIGRTSDFAILPSGKKAAGLTFYYITKSVIENTGMVKEFVIRQTQLDEFEIDYVSTQELNESQKNEISKAIDLYLEPNLNFIFNRKEVLTRTKAGKLKQFTSLVKS